MLTTKKAQQRNLSDETAEIIRKKIIQGELVPGQKLSEALMCEKLSISRNTLREVFRILTIEGLLVYELNKGVFVTIPSIETVIDIYRVRRLVECHALAQASHFHPAYLKMQDAVQAALISREQENWLEVGSANMLFHQAIVELTDSERLNNLFKHLLAELRLIFGMLQNAYFLHAPYVDKNKQILELVAQNQVKQATHLMRDYLNQSEQAILASYSRFQKRR